MSGEVCRGTIVWYDVAPGPPRDEPAAVLECSTCGWICTTGNLMDDRHATASLLRSPR